MILSKEQVAGAWETSDKKKVLFLRENKSFCLSVSLLSRLSLSSTLPLFLTCLFFSERWADTSYSLNISTVHLLVSSAYSDRPNSLYFTSFTFKPSTLSAVSLPEGRVGTACIKSKPWNFYVSVIFNFFPSSVSSSYSSSSSASSASYSAPSSSILDFNALIMVRLCFQIHTLCPRLWFVHD